MCRLIESIRLQNGQFFNLSYHEQRMKYSLQTLNGYVADINLENFLTGFDYPRKGLHKCRIVYDDSTLNVTFTPYQPRTIHSLKLVEDDNISYDLKYENRTSIDELFKLRNGCDDILIIKNGFVTDTSHANILFKKGEEWFTPRLPLLKGTVRQRLIDEHKVIEKDIKPADIYSFEAFKLINAMLQTENDEISVGAII